jgi:hypothetical protein
MSDRLHDFARAVVLRKEQQRTDILDEETLRTVARDLGMTDDELLAARAEGSARIQRARTLRQSGLVDEAIVELESAHAFSPLDLEASTMLADALVHRGRRNDDDADMQRARSICLAVLQAAPGHREAASLLNVVKNNPAGAHARVPAGVVAVGVAVVVAMLLAVVWAVWR